VDATGGRGGLAVRLDEHHHYELEVDGGTVRLWARIGPTRAVVASRSVPLAPVVLTLDVSPRPGHRRADRTRHAVVRGGGAER